MTEPKTPRIEWAKHFYGLQEVGQSFKVPESKSILQKLHAAANNWRNRFNPDFQVVSRNVNGERIITRVK